jgi:hypothetical protein
VGESDI